MFSSYSKDSRLDITGYQGYDKIKLIKLMYMSSKGDQKYLGTFEMWCWRRMEKISWTDRVRNEEVLDRGKEERNIIHTVKRRKANWIGHVLRRNCLLKT
jgi:hypothetical protein